MPRPLIRIRIKLNNIANVFLEKSLSYAELQHGISQLNGEQADVVILRFVLGLPISQVAQVLGKSEDAVKGLQRRSLMTLRQLLSK